MADDAKTTQAKPYVFDALQPGQIRLLRVSKTSSVVLAYRRKKLRGFWEKHPKRDGKKSRRYWSNVEFDLNTVPLTNFKDDYTAMSYAWGYQHPRRGVFSKNGMALDISQNLEALLQYVVKHRREEWIWIDALCINQASMSERSSQVSIMRDIYARAALVCAWLPNHQSPGYHGISPENGASSIEEYVGLFQQASSGVESAATKIRERRLEMREARWGLDALFEEAWFMRVWPIQEVVTAKRVLFAWENEHIEWETMVAFARGLELHGLRALVRSGMYRGSQSNRSPGQVPIGFNNLLFLADMRDRFRRVGVLVLSETLLSTIRFSATEPHDRIFALLGLCQSGSIESDYGLSVEEVYRTSTEHLITHEQSLRILTIAGSGHDEPRNLHYPSWVPKYNRWLQYTPILEAFRDGIDAVNLEASPCIVEDSRLITAGKIFDEIDCLSFPVDSDFGNDLRSFRDMCRLFNWNGYPTGQDWTEAIGEIIMGGPILADQFRGSHSVEDFKSALGFTRAYPEYGLTHFGDITSNLRAFASMAERRRCFSTKEGYVGLSGAFIKKGDKIAYLVGYATPVLLRDNDGGSTYEFVADCYIPGRMKPQYTGETQTIVIR